MPITFVRFLSIIGITSFLLFGCDRGPSAATVYGRASNPDRQSRGLPVVPAGWIERSGGIQADWDNPAFQNYKTTHAPMHATKATFVDQSGNPVSETDSYQSGKQYTSIGGDPGQMFWESLAITYDFRAARQGEEPWSARANCGPLQKTNGAELTLNEAEAVLAQWGLNRLGN